MKGLRCYGGSSDLVFGARPLGAIEHRQGIAMMLIFRNRPCLVCQDPSSPIKEWRERVFHVYIILLGALECL